MKLRVQVTAAQSIGKSIADNFCNISAKVSVSSILSHGAILCSDLNMTAPSLKSTPRQSAASAISLC